MIVFMIKKVKKFPGKSLPTFCRPRGYQNCRKMPKTKSFQPGLVHLPSMVAFNWLPDFRSNAG